MFNLDPVIVNLAVALGIGLLIGGERERRKSEGPSHAPAGLRTFTFASLAGAISYLAGGALMLGVTTAGITALTALSYWRTNRTDPGLTTEVALVLIVLLGGLSIQQPGLAAGLAVTIAILLAARSPLHHFVHAVLTEDEGKDALIFAGATLVILPLLPDQSMGPFGALNPYKIWLVLVLVMGISAAGYIAVRLLGPRFGLPLAGLASGFISSTATIGAMGSRAAKMPGFLSGAVAGAVLSTVATVIQMAAVVGTISAATLKALAGPLISAGIMAIIYGAFFTLRALRDKTDADLKQGKAFSFATAAMFAAMLAVILLVSAALREWFGETGAVLAAAAAGLVDTHAAAISIASLVASGKMSAAEAVVPILAGITTNTISKIVFARTGGSSPFALRVIPGLLLVAAAAWAGSLLHLFTS